MHPLFLVWNAGRVLVFYQGGVAEVNHYVAPTIPHSIM